MRAAQRAQPGLLRRGQRWLVSDNNKCVIKGLRLHIVKKRLCFVVTERCGMRLEMDRAGM